jgi:hypothetical protein
MSINEDFGYHVTLSAQNFSITTGRPSIPKIEPINTRQEVAKIAKVSEGTVDNCR